MWHPPTWGGDAGDPATAPMARGRPRPRSHIRLRHSRRRPYVDRHDHHHDHHDKDQGPCRSGGRLREQELKATTMASKITQTASSPKAVISMGTISHSPRRRRGGRWSCGRRWRRSWTVPMTIGDRHVKPRREMADRPPLVMARLLAAAHAPDPRLIALPQGPLVVVRAGERTQQADRGHADLQRRTGAHPGIQNIARRRDQVMSRNPKIGTAEHGLEPGAAPGFRAARHRRWALAPAEPEDRRTDRRTPARIRVSGPIARSGLQESALCCVKPHM